MAVLLPIVQWIAAPYALFSSAFTFIHSLFLERFGNKIHGLRAIRKVQIRFSDLFINAVFGYLIAAFLVLKNKH
ncbi:hypothetical protein D5074_03905 [Pectobacterium polaris]|nr:hypothetical protein D5074_03905 [Pectobacterium polaris]